MRGPFKVGWYPFKVGWYPFKVGWYLFKVGWYLFKVLRGARLRLGGASIVAAIGLQFQGTVVVLMIMLTVVLIMVVGARCYIYSEVKLVICSMG